MATTTTAPRSATFPARSGKRIDFLQVTKDDIEVTDIATALAKICRFGGQLKEFYSVAQHSVIVSRLCPPNLKLAGLFHDGGEAYIGDVITPLKKMLALLYGPIEERFERAIFEKLSLQFESLKEIKRYDLQAYDAENAYFRHNDLAAWQEINASINLSSELWLPFRAENMFLKEFDRLVNNGSK